jgi:hypothetical protein
MRKPVELFYFFQINDAASFKSALRDHVITLVTSTSVLIASPKKQPLSFMNIAFSQRGLNALGITDNLGDSFFSAGQLADASQLGDNVAGNWDPAFKGSGIHGVLLIASDRQRNVNRMLASVLSFFGSSISETTRLQGTARPGSEAGHERTYFFTFCYLIVRIIQPLFFRLFSPSHTDQLTCTPFSLRWRLTCEFLIATQTLASSMVSRIPL